MNTVGAFYCDCAEGYEGPSCDRPRPTVPGLQAEALSYVGPAELIGIGALVFIILVLLVLFLGFRRKLFRRRCGRGDLPKRVDRGSSFPPLKVAPRGMFPDARGPPQVLVRPTAYTLPRLHGRPCVDRDGPADRLGLSGAEATALHTPCSDSPPFLAARRGVAVCSVAPNLPQHSPCHSVCSSKCKTAGVGEGREKCTVIRRAYTSLFH